MKLKLAYIIEIGLAVLLLNLVIYLIFTLIYLGLYLDNSEDNYFTTTYGPDNLSNLNNAADIFYFGTIIHSNTGIGDIIPKSSVAKAFVSIHVMLVVILNTGLALYYCKKFIN